MDDGAPNLRYAAAQVKNGCDDLNVEDYLGFPVTVYLFTSRGRCIGGSAANVECLTLDQLDGFMRDDEALLPERFKIWIGIARELSSIFSQPSGQEYQGARVQPGGRTR
jgi:hypothetical protein